MRAMVLERAGEALEERELPDPEPASGEVVVRVQACAVCRTDLHVVDGELADPKLPLVPGHQVVGLVEEVGEHAERLAPGDRVGIPWLGWTCGECRYCRSGRENLCELARFTGYTLDGGYAELAVADERYAFHLPEPAASGPDRAAGGSETSRKQAAAGSVVRAVEQAPLLCAGLIGYRSLRFCGDAERLGLYGFGASAHIVCQVARHEGRRVFALTRPGDQEAQRLARSLGAEWAGGTDEELPAQLDAAIVFAPVGELVPRALAATAPGGTVVCAGIYMSDIPAFPYELLWGERSIRSVANLTRRDGEEFLPLAAEVPIRTTVTPYGLTQANEALADLREGRVGGAAVLSIGG